jgi:hypothetical protein
MGYAVYHVEKGGISSGGIGNHIDRAAGAEHSYRHSDASQRHLNKNYEVTKYCQLPLHEAITSRIEEGYTQSKAIRKDAVKYCTHVLTGSHEEMKHIFSKPDTAELWIKANRHFVEQEFGKDNILRFTLHMDEKTPHLHVVTVPLTGDGRLSAKEMIGNRLEMQARQDRYSEAMERFGLKRGEKSTGVSHESAREYYSRIEKGLKSEAPIKIEKNFFGVVTEKTLSTALSAVERANTLVSELKSREEQTKGQIKQQSALVSELKKNLSEERYQNKLILLDPGRYQEQKAKFDGKLINALIFSDSYGISKTGMNLGKAANEMNLKPQDLRLFLETNPKASEEVSKYIEKRQERNQNQNKNKGLKF